MVDDPENTYTKLENTRNLIPGNENNPEEKKEKKYEERKICFKVTLIPLITVQTCTV